MIPWLKLKQHVRSNERWETSLLSQKWLRWIYENACQKYSSSSNSLKFIKIQGVVKTITCERSAGLFSHNYPFITVMSLDTCRINIINIEPDRRRNLRTNLWKNIFWFLLEKVTNFLPHFNKKIRCLRRVARHSNFRIRCHWSIVTDVQVLIFM